MDPSAVIEAAGPRERHRRGLRLGRVLGIEVLLRRGWLPVSVLLTWAFTPVVKARVPGVGSSAYAVSAAFALLLYASVLVHELGHSVLARRFGLPVTRIELGPLGGGTLLGGRPVAPARSAAIAAVGPLCSLLLGALAAGAAALLPEAGVPRVLAVELAVANIAVGAVNLLPGLPLDGGRVLAAVAELAGSRTPGVRVAGWSGRLLGVVVALLPGAAAALGHGFEPAFVVVGAAAGAWLWVAATGAMAAATLAGRVEALEPAALVRVPLALPAATPVSAALQQLARAGRGDVLVVDSAGRPVGYLTAEALAAVPEARAPWVEVGAASAPVGAWLPAGLRGEALVETLRREPAEAYLLERPVGVGLLVTLDVVAALHGPRGVA